MRRISAIEWGRGVFPLEFCGHSTTRKEHAMAYEIKSILYASDLTPRSPAVFRHAVGLAHKFDARLHAMTVMLPATGLPYMEFISEDKFEQISTAGRNKEEELLRRRIEIFAEAHPELDTERVLASTRAVVGDPARCILDMAKHVLADIIVMGSRGHSAIGEIILGSVAHKVTMKSDIPVILVPIDR